MRAWVARLAAGLLAASLAACSNPFAPEYEYDEQIYLSVDGSATVVVNSSLPALVALRGAAVDPSYETRDDRASIRTLYERGGCTVDSVSRFWSCGDRPRERSSIASVSPAASRNAGSCIQSGGTPACAGSIARAADALVIRSRAASA